MFASFVNIVNNVNAMSKPTRYTITLPAELDKKLTEICEDTGVALADLLRQGGIRILTEKLATGRVELMQMPKCAA